LRSILIIKEDGLKIDPKLLEQFEKEHKTYVACSLTMGDKIIDKYHIDMALIVAKYHIKSETKKFIKELHERYEETIPIIFVSEEVNAELSELLDDYVWWRSIRYPIDHQKIMSQIDKMMKFANSFDVKKFTLKKNYHSYTYSVKNVSHFYRPADKRVVICNLDPITLVKEEEDFFYKFRLDLFPVHHDIERYFKQANQSCFVNSAYVKIVKPGKMELVLRCGKIISTSKNYIHNFIKEE